MANPKKASKGSKSLDKKSMKKTKGGIIAVRPGTEVKQDFHFSTGDLQVKLNPGQISSGDGSV